MSESFFIGFSKEGQAISVLPFIDENTGFVKGMKFEVTVDKIKFFLPQELANWCEEKFVENGAEENDCYYSSLKDISLIFEKVLEWIKKCKIKKIEKGELVGYVDDYFDGDKMIYPPRIWYWEVSKKDMPHIRECPLCGAKRKVISGEDK